MHKYTYQTYDKNIEYPVQKIVNQFQQKDQKRNF